MNSDLCFVLQTNLRDEVGIINQSSHPHVSEKDGSYNLGQVIGAMGPQYAIVHYPPVGVSSSSSVKQARIVSRVPCRSMKEPSYMHSFSITESFYVLIEQPLTVSLKSVCGSILSGKPIVHSLKWRQKMV